MGDIISLNQWPMPIEIMEFIQNSSQYLSIPLNTSQWRLRGIEKSWSELTSIGINARILIGIDWYWSAFGHDRGSPVFLIYLYSREEGRIRRFNVLSLDAVSF